MNFKFGFLLILLPALLFSQAETGVIAGINNSRLINGFLEDFETEKSFCGIHLGAYMDLGDVDSLDFGPNLGIGYEFNHFSIETSFYQGANTLLETDDATLPNPNRIKFTNAVIQISLKYKI